MRTEKNLPKTGNLFRIGHQVLDDQQQRENIVSYDIFYRLDVGRQNDHACEWLWGSELMPNTRKILIVDDDPELRDALTEQLSLHEEFEAVAAENGSKGVQAAKAGQIDLVIMDVGLPDIDGREAVRILRRNGFKAPIIMLTGHGTDSDTILGLESGANDYVTKPFRFAVLLARIRTQLRQHETSEDAVFTIGPYTFRPSSKLLLNPKGSKVRLTEKETSILRYLYRVG